MSDSSRPVPDERAVSGGRSQLEKPLAGVRVLDLSRILAGPYATMMLADMGAEVIKVERPGAGDDTRHWGPPYAEAQGARASAYFLSVNRGKKSLALDMKSPEGQEILRDLAARSDVVVENFKPGDLARYGLDAASLQARNPRLVYCAITGFGQSGPRAHQPGYDLMIQGHAGLMSLTGQAAGSAGAGPLKVGVALVDVLTGLTAANAILAALFRAARSGKGAVLDISLFDVCAASLVNQAMNYLVGGQIPQPMGNLHPNIAPYQSYETASGHMLLAIGNDAQFARFVAAAGLGALRDDPRFARNETRVANRAALNALLEPVLRSRSTEDWLALCASEAIPAGPINSLDAVFADPHALETGLVQSLPHATLGAVPAVRNPVFWDAEMMTADRAAPELGAQSADVLESLGRTRAQIEALTESGVIGVPV